MSRLTDKDSYCLMSCADDYKGTESIGENCKLYKACFERKMYDKLKHYEDLEEQGRLIELPCKPCERVWVANGCHEPWQTVCSRIHQIVNIMEIGWAIGYTKAEAEVKLAELKGGDNR